MTHFATPATQDTCGPRGKTTSKRAKTVRGAEGAYIAATKDEIATRPAGWLVRYELAFRGSCSGVWGFRPTTFGRFDTREQAKAAMATLAVGPEHMTRGPNGDSYIARVWVEKECRP